MEKQIKKLGAADLARHRMKLRRPDIYSRDSKALLLNLLNNGKAALPLMNRVPCYPSFVLSFSVTLVSEIRLFF